MNLKILTLSALLAFSFNSALALENHPSNNEEAIENILKDNQKVKSSITLPKGYKIKKLFKEAYLYGSFTDEVLIILHSPTTNEKTNNDYTIDDYIKLESSNSTCSAPINTKQGKQITCKKENNEWVSFFRVVPSGLIVQSNSNNVNISQEIITPLENLSIALLFYSLNIARDEEDINYIHDLLEEYEKGQNLPQNNK